MRKIILIIFIISLITSGCAKNVSPNTDKGQNTPPKTTEKAVEPITVSNYFPLRQDTIYTYKGTGNEYASKVSSLEYLKGRVAQFNTNNGGTSLSEVFIVGQGAVKKVFSLGERYWREDFTGKKGQEEIILQQPFKVGSTWTSNGKTFRITDINANVTVPYGTYKAIKVVNDLQDATFARYFAPNIGIIKEEYLSAGNSITSELAEMKTEPVKMSFELYFPDKNAEGLKVKKAEVLLHTNESMAEKILIALENPTSSDVNPGAPSQTKLLDYKREDTVLRLNFSKELLGNMNAGSSLEGLYLDAIVNTFGKAYGVEGVIINVENKPYESGHFGFGKDEVLKIK